MIEQQGVVVGLEGDDAWVRVGGQTGCPACDAGRGCGAGLFGALLRRSEARVRVANGLGAQPGDPVILGLRESDYLSLVLLLYGWPVLAGVSGAVLAQALAAPVLGSEGWVVDLLAATGGLAAGVIVLQRGRRTLVGRFTGLSLEMLNPAVRLDCASTDRTQ